MRVHIVDVCGTLVRDDTTLGLLFYHFKQGEGPKPRYWILLALAGRLSPIRIAFVILEKITGRHWLKYAAVALLRGASVTHLDRSAQGYASHLLRHRRIPPVWAVIERPLAAKSVILASASLEPIVAALAAELDVTYVASSLEIANDRITGRYRRDVSGTKGEALTEKFGKDLWSQSYTLITDNYSDRELLMDAAGRYVVVHPGTRVKWGRTDAIYLEAEV